MSDSVRSAQTRGLFERLAGALVCTILLAASPMLGLPMTALLWCGVLAGLLMRAPTRATGALFLALTLYSATAWLAAANGNHYFPPFPTLALIESTTLTDLRGVITAYLLVELIFGARRLDGAVREASRRARGALRRLARTPVRPIAIAVLLAVGIWDWIGLARIGLGAVLGDSRRAHANSLLLTTDHNVQFVVIALSIAAGAFAFFGEKRAGSLLALAVCWSPFVLVGSRKELLLMAATLAVLLATSTARRWLIPIAGLVSFMFLRPVLGTADFYDALHEFILPQYMHFALQMGLVAPDFAGPFWERAQFLLPGPLRWSEPTDMALAFFRTGATEVGVGASPFAEAETIAPGLPVELTFAVIFTALVGVLIATRRTFFFVSIICFAQMLTLGRSDTWIALFFVIYSALVLHLLVALTSKRKPSHAYISFHRQHPRPHERPEPARRITPEPDRDLLPHGRRAIRLAKLREAHRPVGGTGPR
ncbi:hypothetical protein GCM10009768_30770 [Leucobacter iarius]|uniref:Uncharacterized protein n=1 Tax=Leucobacter iarius TaxID=333963 RepID=A0ABP4Y3I9_9MICO